MTKPRLIDWLETETGQQLDRKVAPAKTRHVSIRVPDELFALLEATATATAQGETVSQCARRLLEGGLLERAGPVVAIDEAILRSKARARLSAKPVTDPRDPTMVGHR